MCIDIFLHTVGKILESLTQDKANICRINRNGKSNVSGWLRDKNKSGYSV